MERQIVIRHETLELAAAIHYPKGAASQDGQASRVPLTIICHGFTGNRIGVDRLFVKTARALAEAGHLTIRFDYAGCGESTGEYGYLGLDSMIAQTRAVIDYALSCGNVDATRVTLIGHSLGGAVALLTAVKDKRVKRLALWSAVAYPFNDIVKIIGRENYDQATMQGVADYLGYSFGAGFFESLARHQPFVEARKFGGDVLLVHGTSDDVIPVDYCHLYQKIFWQYSEGHCDQEIIFQADHTYSSGPHQRLLIEKTKSWLNRLEQRQEDWQHWTI